MENVKKIIKIVIIAILAIWMLIFVIDYFRARGEKHPLICISEKRKTVEGNEFYSCTSLGYKYYEYQENGRKTFGFGAAFLKSEVEKKIEESKW